MRNSLSRQRGKPPWKLSGRLLVTPAMPPAKLGSEKADRSSVDRWRKDALAHLPLEVTQMSRKVLSGVVAREAGRQSV